MDTDVDRSRNVAVMEKTPKTGRAGVVTHQKNHHNNNDEEQRNHSNQSEDRDELENEDSAEEYGDTTKTGYVVEESLSIYDIIMMMVFLKRRAELDVAVGSHGPKLNKRARFRSLLRCLLAEFLGTATLTYFHGKQLLRRRM